MPLTEYVSTEEVQRVCKKLGFRDWSKIDDPVVTDEESSTILKLVNVSNMDITPENFKQGLEVELEHGTRYEEANVTNNHPVLTGKIVLAHLKESLDYYKRIDVAEIEGDLLAAVLSKNLAKIESKYKKLIEAQKILNHSVAEQLNEGQV
ncbi:MAG: hypothetical protein GY941_04200 [Planctomycetes bacterium]|nr:hypothetical protein [Planctomycetota bacterium]